MASSNVVWHKGQISRDDRIKILGNSNKVLWFTGFSGSGKSTIAVNLEKELNKKGILTYILDGDNIRHGLNSNLGFSIEDRDENIRRISEVTKLMYDAGIYTLVCFISPHKNERNNARKLIGNNFIEIFVDCSIEECEKRDTKGMYKKARTGEIKDFTGISAPYDKPEKPEITLDTKELNVEQSVSKILNYINSLN
ncbi:adenylyl-sulfate kinase [Candidatus Woesearchaeota archaeon]|jgi:adenylylsulfate kinase|nr:adenylyl-sulfate kinase [Candidatus Woesearchaeota archaeon]